MSRVRNLYEVATEVISPTIHVRYAGRSHDFTFAQLEIGLGAADAEIRTATAQAIGVDPAAFDKMVVERHESGNVTLRPEAVFGR